MLRPLPGLVGGGAMGVAGGNDPPHKGAFDTGQSFEAGVGLVSASETAGTIRAMRVDVFAEISARCNATRKLDG